MTLTRFVTKNAFRNKRRSTLTVLSIAFSLLLLTLMMTIWRAFYLDQGSAESAERLVVRHRVSLTFNLPGYYREKIRAIPGVVSVVPVSWFGGIYKDQKPENFFAQFGTDPEEFFKTYRDVEMPEDQATAWQRDRQGVIVNDSLAKKYGWKLGDRIVLQGTIYPINLELNVRGIYHTNPDNKSVYFNAKYVEEAVDFFKGRAGTFSILAASPGRCEQNCQRRRRYVPQLASAHKNGEREGFRPRVRRHDGQCESVHSEHLLGGGLRYAAGVGQYHGDVHPRAHARSGCAEDAGLHQTRRAGAVRERSGGALAGRRTAWSRAGVVDGLRAYPFSSVLQLFPHEGHAGNMAGGAAHVGAGGIA